jgi:predicted lipoprotein with Yx(FWY)xxD motif
MKKQPGSAPLSSPVRAILSLILLFASGYLASSCSGGTLPNPAAYTIREESMPFTGVFLTDASGLTLYYNTTDADNQVGATAGALEDWPAFYAASVVVAPDLEKTDFGTLMRADGKPQTTYRGWPLFRYAHDSEPGDAAGQGREGVWFIALVNVAPPGLTFARST